MSARNREMRMVACNGTEMPAMREDTVNLHAALQTNACCLASMKNCVSLCSSRWKALSNAGANSAWYRKWASSISVASIRSSFEINRRIAKVYHLIKRGGRLNITYQTDTSARDMHINEVKSASPPIARIMPKPRPSIEMRASESWRGGVRRGGMAEMPMRAAVAKYHHCVLAWYGGREKKPVEARQYYKLSNWPARTARNIKNIFKIKAVYYWRK